MDKYERVVDGYGVELEPFTSEYLALYSDGIGLLKRFIQATFRKGCIQKGDVVSTEDIEEFLRKEREEQVKLV